MKQRADAALIDAFDTARVQRAFDMACRDARGGAAPARSRGAQGLDDPRGSPMDILGVACRVSSSFLIDMRAIGGGRSRAQGTCRVRIESADEAFLAATSDDIFFEFLDDASLPAPDVQAIFAVPNADPIFAEALVSARAELATRPDFRALAEAVELGRSAASGRLAPEQGRPRV